MLPHISNDLVHKDSISLEETIDQNLNEIIAENKDFLAPDTKKETHNAPNKCYFPFNLFWYLATISYALYFSLVSKAICFLAQLSSTFFSCSSFSILCCNLLMITFKRFSFNMSLFIYLIHHLSFVFYYIG